MNGKPLFGSAALRIRDAPDPTDRIGLDDFRLGIRPAGEGFELYLADAQSPYREKFKGTTWFPVDRTYRVTGELIAYKDPKTMDVPYTDGTFKRSTGELVFPVPCLPKKTG